MKSLATVAIAAAAVLAPACATTSTRSLIPPGTTASSNDVRLVVMNNGWLDEDIYAYYLGSKYRIGTVTGLTTAVLHVRTSLLQPDNSLQLLVHPIGGSQDYLSPVVTLMDHGHPELTIDPATNSISLAVMPNRR